MFANLDSSETLIKPKSEGSKIKIKHLHNTQNWFKEIVTTRLMF